MPTRELFLLFSLCSEKGGLYEKTLICQSGTLLRHVHPVGDVYPTISILGTIVLFPMKRNLHDKPQSASSSPTQSPKTPRPSKLVAPTTIQSGPEPTGARGNITRKSPVPATSALSSPRYRVDVPILPESQPVGDKKLVVRRKEGDKK